MSLSQNTEAVADRLHASLARRITEFGLGRIEVNTAALEALLRSREALSAEVGRLGQLVELFGDARDAADSAYQDAEAAIARLTKRVEGLPTQAEIEAACECVMLEMFSLREVRPEAAREAVVRAALLGSRKYLRSALALGDRNPAGAESAAGGLGPKDESPAPRSGATPDPSPLPQGTRPSPLSSQGSGWGEKHSVPPASQGSGSREPGPTAPALTGFDPSRGRAS